MGVSLVSWPISGCSPDPTLRSIDISILTWMDLSYELKEAKLYATAVEHAPLISMGLDFHGTVHLYRKWSA